jgi:hypothetical protein
MRLGKVDGFAFLVDEGEPYDTCVRNQHIQVQHYVEDTLALVCVYR